MNVPCTFVQCTKYSVQRLHMSWTPGWLTGSRVLATEWAPWIKSIETLMEAEAAGECRGLTGRDGLNKVERKKKKKSGSE